MVGTIATAWPVTVWNPTAGPLMPSVSGGVSRSARPNAIPGPGDRAAYVEEWLWASNCDQTIAAWPLGPTAASPTAAFAASPETTWADRRPPLVSRAALTPTRELSSTAPVHVT